MVAVKNSTLKNGTSVGYVVARHENDNGQEQWIPTVCTMCDSGCMIQVRVKDGIANAIKGIPGVPPNYGKMCAKGKSALAELYAPGRVLARCGSKRLRTKGTHSGRGYLSSGLTS